MRRGASDCRAAELLSTQIVSSTGESNSSPTRLQSCSAVVNAFRDYEEEHDLATPKFWGDALILGLAYPPHFLKLHER
jgi:hypothetical protein